MIKCRRALRETGLRRLIVAGGVSANQQLRAGLQALLRAEGGRVYFPRLEFCTDNGAMIAYAGYVRMRAGQTEALGFQPRPRWPMADLNQTGAKPCGQAQDSPVALTGA